MQRVIFFLLFLSLLAMPHFAIAQQPGSADRMEMMKRLRDPAAMQKMAAEAEAAQKCMEGIEKKELDALQKRAEAASKEIEELCEAGKKGEALTKGLALSREMRSNATIKKLRACSEGMSETMKAMMPTPLPAQDEPTDSDICS